MKKIFLLAAMGVGMLMAACDNDTPAPKLDDNPQETEVTEQIPDEIPYTHIQLSESQKEMKDANNEFAFRLFKSVSENEDNTAFSPYSLFACLSMAANGDNGECRDLILNELGVGEGPEALAKLNSFNALMARMMPKADSRAFMLSANSVWINDGMRPYVNPSFISVVTGDCSAYVEYADFNDASGTMNLINKWGADHTNGLILQILDKPLTGDMALLNASYFKGWWTQPFNKKATDKLQFRNLDGSVSKVDMLRDTREVFHAYGNGMRVMALPYGNGNFRMVFAMPDEGSDFNSFLTLVSYASVMEALGKGRTYNATIWFPKFNLSSNLDLLETLKNNGLARLVNDGLDNIFLNAMKATVCNAIQKSTVSTDEMGTVGASITEIELSASLNNGENKTEVFPFDRPFIFFIEETSTSTVLFIGKVTKF